MKKGLLLLCCLFIISGKAQSVLTDKTADNEIKKVVVFDDYLGLLNPKNNIKADKSAVKTEKSFFLKKRFKEKEKKRFAEVVKDIDIFLTRIKIIDSARVYIGTPYHYGGMSKDGIDCSALIYKAYKKNNFSLPRTSIEQSKLGEKIKREKADIGDLIFFKTNRRRSISHVGIVIENCKGDIRFIHASSSKGVMISSLMETYFKKKFVKIKRLIL